MLSPPIDIYTVEVADVQVFIERQDQVFNFYLLDSGIILPDSKTIVPQSDDSSSDNEMRNDTTADKTTTTVEQQDNQDQQNDEAQQLVDQMLSTVQQLVTKRGNWKGALDQQRHTLTCKLKELQLQPNKVSAVQESVRVMRQVGEAVAKKTESALPAAPLRKEEQVPPPMVRVGRVIVRELRIFTRDNLASALEREDVLLNEWNKPIRVDKVTVRASELTPPMSLTEGADKLPAIYQPIDKVFEVVWKRTLAESAKSQGGRLLNTAIGQVLGFMKVSTKS